MTARRLRGPIARAAGLADDARAEDPEYAALGFTVLTAPDGDARSRARLHVAEALAALALARRVPQSTHAVDSGTRRAGIEGPRGPLVARRLPAGWLLAALGAEEARRTGAELARGLEWASALVAIGSLDLSPWRVGPA